MFISRLPLLLGICFVSLSAMEVPSQEIERQQLKKNCLATEPTFIVRWSTLDPHHAMIPMPAIKIAAKTVQSLATKIVLSAGTQTFLYDLEELACKDISIEEFDTAMMAVAPSGVHLAHAGHEKNPKKLIVQCHDSYELGSRNAKNQIGYPQWFTDNMGLVVGPKSLYEFQVYGDKPTIEGIVDYEDTKIVPRNTLILSPSLIAAHLCNTQKKTDTDAIVFFLRSNEGLWERLSIKIDFLKDISAVFRSGPYGPDGFAIVKLSAKACGLWHFDNKNQALQCLGAIIEKKKEIEFVDCAINPKGISLAILAQRQLFEGQVAYCIMWYALKQSPKFSCGVPVCIGTANLSVSFVAQRLFWTECGIVVTDSQDCSYYLPSDEHLEEKVSAYASKRFTALLKAGKPQKNVSTLFPLSQQFEEFGPLLKKIKTSGELDTNNNTI